MAVRNRYLIKVYDRVDFRYLYNFDFHSRSRSEIALFIQNKFANPCQLYVVVCKKRGSAIYAFAMNNRGVLLGSRQYDVC